MKFLFVIGLVLALVLAGCAGSTPNNPPAASNPVPQVQTPSPAAQQPVPTQTYSCPDGTVVTDLSKCQKQKCSDGTEYGSCSLTKPKFCENGGLVDKAGTCGCVESFIVSGNSCVDSIIGCWFDFSNGVIDYSKYMQFNNSGLGVDKETNTFPMTWERISETQLVVAATGIMTVKMPISTNKNEPNIIQVGTIGKYQRGDCSRIATAADIAKANEKYCPHLPNVPADGLKPTTGSFEYSLDSNILEQVEWDGWQWEKNIFDSTEYQSLYCNHGKKTGENVNYIYCSYGMGSLTKSFANENGIVDKVASYSMKWVYAPSGNGFEIKEIQYYSNMFDSNPACTSKYS